MCGIAGVVYFTPTTPEESLIRKMTDVIGHRGPDDYGFWAEPHVGLGFRRLSIIDLSEGHQPLANEDESVWITFNGEIYNYKTLRQRLESQGHVFRTNTDTEVIVHLYEELGEDCVKELRGMFGFVIWDRRRKMLFGARDHFGIKPFYYAHDGDRLLYGSEIKSLLAAGVERRLRQESLLNYMTFQYVPEPYTMFEGVNKLPPAHTITVTPDGAVSIRRYWDPMFEPVEGPLDMYIEELRAKLADSVKHHMVSDVERGCFLSSGIDSTAIAAHMRRIEPIRTFSVGFEGPNNETTVAEQTARALGTEHYSRVITEQDYFDSLPKAIWHQDEPVADPSAIALYHVAKLAAEHVTVVLSGEGADELFGGYRIYREPRSLAAVSWLPGSLKRALRTLAEALPAGVRGRNYLIRAATPLEERFLGNARIFSEDAKAELVRFGGQLLDSYTNPVQTAKTFYDRTKHLDPVSRMQYIDLNLWMPGDILMKADKMTMAHSLELRVPFLDKELFELARRIPARHRIAGGTTKYVFRRAMEGIVPDFVQNRPKLGFPVPLRSWLKGPRGTLLLEQIEAAELGHIFDMRQVERMVSEHVAGTADHARKLWVLYVFALWHDAYLKEQASPLAAAAR
ncbi:asparagine synthase (glutamine-hydrolyzing) [Paenibacillus thermoaerophilus]|uniref:asparagine synthase (glutamine-hydrolyzing) n=1 Tax=Paenibacillus thermoaerophilus TaxID=1215385 RepID=A0ABW2V3J6_9BACL|nr:asparagine synthase (glutamine-hydrolyzing) [Paenibacillus thermoaerophilus]TMV18416.1 asparagine synthase (glutamine-hydrolyzing) [Paenibacillus thermoaerophilus]